MGKEIALLPNLTALPEEHTALARGAHVETAHSISDITRSSFSIDHLRIIP